MPVDYHVLTNKLRTSLSEPLPGKTAHKMMWVPGRADYPDIPDDAKKAAVLVLIYKKIDRPFIALIKRVQHQADRHSGQVSFPGGKMEATDDYPVQTALREAFEELGIPQDLEVIGSLSPLYIPVSGYYVTPVVGIMDAPFLFTIEEKEVDELLEIDCEYFIQESSKSNTSVVVRSGTLLHQVPCYQIEDTTIWGATAMILAELEHLLRR